MSPPSHPSRAARLARGGLAKSSALPNGRECPRPRPAAGCRRGAAASSSPASPCPQLQWSGRRGRAGNITHAEVTVSDLGGSDPVGGGGLFEIGSIGARRDGVGRDGAGEGNGGPVPGPPARRRVAHGLAARRVPARTLPRLSPPAGAPGDRRPRRRAAAAGWPSARPGWMRELCRLCRLVIELSSAAGRGTERHQCPSRRIAATTRASRHPSSR